MVASQAAASRPLGSPAIALHRTQDIGAEPGAAFRTICEVEKWPVWLSFLKSARRLDRGPLARGREVAIRSAIPGESEELYEVDAFLDGHIVALVGAYSVRRRIDFRIEGRGERSKVFALLSYPSYGGFWGGLLDRLTARRRLESALGDSLVHLKGLVEFDSARQEALADF